MKTEILDLSHLPAVSELEALTFRRPWSETALRHLLTGPNFGVVALDGDRVIAYVGLAAALDEGEITNVATHPAYRRRGAARAVLLRLLDEAKARGLGRLTLEVRESNAAAIELYSKLGFKVEGKRRDFYTKPTEAALVMIWRA